MNLANPSNLRCVYERHTPNSLGIRSVTLVFGLLLLFLSLMELKARVDDYPTTYPFSPDAWVTQWYRLDDLPDDQTVFLGASRVRHGLIIDTWELHTGDRPLNLAWPGSPALPVLEELAKRQSFKGTVVCGIAPLVVFAAEGPPWMEWINQNIKLTETQRWSLSFHLSQHAHHFIRPRLKLANSAAYSPLSNLYFNFPLRNRKGLLPPIMFRFIGTTDDELQDRYLPSFVSDPAQQQVIKEQLKHFNLRQLHYGFADFEQVIDKYATAARTIRARGGNVIFVRLPSDGWVGGFEDEHYPRQDCYDRLIERTGCFGVHYLDYPILRDLKCVEESHLSEPSGQIFTEEFVKILKSSGELDERP
tara:strand:+ start:424 stop:1506 length:1083 start_codon:yes stop_codon:yes gene_type:complete